MKIEYLKAGSIDCPLIRLYGGDEATFDKLHAAALQLSEGTAIKLALHRTPGFHGLNGCGLTLAVGSRDEGVRLRSLAANFEWTLTRRNWRTVAGLIEPFTRQVANSAYQWLCGREAGEGLNASDISILISKDPAGRW
jgi:hypothetical protein